MASRLKKKATSKTSLKNWVWFGEGGKRGKLCPGWTGNTRGQRYIWSSLEIWVAVNMQTNSQHGSSEASVVKSSMNRKWATMPYLMPQLLVSITLTRKAETRGLLPLDSSARNCNFSLVLTSEHHIGCVGLKTRSTNKPHLRGKGSELNMSIT